MNGTSLSLRRTTTPPLALLVCFALATALAACDQEVSEVESGRDALTGDAFGGDATLGDGFAQGAMLQIAVDAREETVRLDALPEVAAPDGSRAARLSEALEAVAPEGELAEYLCDFVASDGFRTSSKGEGCEPIPCDQTVDAYVVLATGDLVWEPSLNMRGCYRPKGLARVEMTRIDTEPELP